MFSPYIIELDKKNDSNYDVYSFLEGSDYASDIRTKIGSINRFTKGVWAYWPYKETQKSIMMFPSDLRSIANFLEKLRKEDPPF